MATVLTAAAAAAAACVSCLLIFNELLRQDGPALVHSLTVVDAIIEWDCQPLIIVISVIM